MDWVCLSVGCVFGFFLGVFVGKATQVDSMADAITRRLAMMNDRESYFFEVSKYVDDSDVNDLKDEDEDEDEPWKKGKRKEWENN